MDATQVAGITVDAKDGAGTRILRVYAKVVPVYAVYRTPDRVVVQYADDATLGADQRQALIALNPVEGEINGLIDDWRAGDPGDSPEARHAHAAEPWLERWWMARRQAVRSRARLFDRRVADALVVGLQGDAPHALDLMTAVKADILAERTAIARTEYLLIAGAATILSWLIFGLGFAALRFAPADQPFFDALWRAGWIGSIGAFFSVALAIRGRQIGTDLQRRDNAVDAILRIVIGAISAIILYCLLRAQLVTFGFGGRAVTVGAGAPTDGGMAYALQTVIAFVAGFSERLVSDTLSRAALVAVPAAAANPLAGGTIVPPASPPPGMPPADETNPLGRPSAGPAPPAEGGSNDPDGDPAAGEGTPPPSPADPAGAQP